MRNTFLTLTVFVSSFLREARCACSDPRSPYRIFRESGTIQSPGFPNYYNANEECSWYLNPPAGRLPQLLITTLVLETNVGYGEGTTCRGVDDYVTLGANRGCDKEGPLCLAYMLNTMSDYSCHNVIIKYFPKCKSLLHNVWPLRVGFNTKDAENMKGFQMNYTFVDCYNYRPARPTMRTTTSPTTSSSTTTLSQGSITKRNVTSPNLDNVQAVNTPTNLNDRPSLSTDKISEKTATKPTHVSRSTPTRSTKLSTLLAIRTTSTAILQEDGSPQTEQTANSTLIVVFVVLCVIFVILMVVFIFRRRIKEFTKNDKSSAKFTTSPTNNNTIKVMDNCVISLDKEAAYQAIEQPSSPTSTASPYKSNDAREIPSISSTLISANSDNSHHFEYSHLDESLQSTTSDESHHNQVYSTSKR